MRTGLLWVSLVSSQVWGFSFPSLHASGRINSRHSSLLAQSSDSKSIGVKEGARGVVSIPKRVVKIYSSYASRLWKETNPEARGIVAKDKASSALRHLQHVASGNQLADVASKEREELAEVCDKVLKSIEKSQMKNVVLDNQSHDTNETNAKVVKKKKSRSVLFGALMGLAVSCWVFSGNLIFTGLFTSMTLLGQLEYYRSVMSTGVNPARRISVVGSCSMFLTALFIPHLHELCLPLFGLYTMIYFLTMKRTISTIPEIATTFTGMFYLGYVPSFWVRVRTLGTGVEPTSLVSAMEPLTAVFSSKLALTIKDAIPFDIFLPVTSGSLFLFWTWLSLAFSDVGAYFFGRRFGRTRLGQVAPAAGATSPNKTVEGVLGGCLVSGILSMWGKFQNCCVLEIHSLL